MVPVLEYRSRDEDDRLVFVATWYDKVSDTTKTFKLSYFPSDNAVELIDSAKNTKFLKRFSCNTVSKEDFTRGLGHSVTILSRQLKLVNYYDELTAAKLQLLAERTFAMVKPDGVDHLGEILSSLDPLTLSEARMLIFNQELAVEFYKEHEGKGFFKDLIEYITSGPVVAMELVGRNAVKTWRDMIGPTDPAKARIDDPNCLRARFGTSVTYNALHGSDSSASARREAGLVFNYFGVKPQMAINPDYPLPVSCMVVLPHAVKSGTAGDIVSDIQRSGLVIVGLVLTELTEDKARMFLEVYDGVVPEYPKLVTEFSSGPALVLAVASLMNDLENEPRGARGGGKPPSLVEKVRRLCGPQAVDLAKQARPESLRAKYGVDQVQKGVYCSDLAELAESDCKFFFNTM